MIRQPHQWLAAMTAVLLLTTSASSWAGSGTGQRASIDESFDANAAELIGVAGHVSIRHHDGHDIRLRAEDRSAGSAIWSGGLKRASSW